MMDAEGMEEEGGKASRASTCKTPQVIIRALSSGLNTVRSK